MRRFSFSILLLALFVSGCALFGPQLPDIKKITDSKVVNPFFKTPPENLQDYQNRTWILLAESKNKNWFYDPYSIFEDEDGIVSFDAFVTERGYEDRLQPFNSTSIGPYLQKIDCFSNDQWSEIFYAQNMPKQETYVNPLKPAQDWGWIKIKPKTAMSYIRTRVCGRKFLDDKNVNYFLYQDGFSKVGSERGKSEGDTKQLLDQSSPVIFGPIPVFYEVLNNEVLMVDAKREIREMRILSYLLEGDFPKKNEMIFSANCQNNSYAVRMLGKGEVLRGKVGSKEAMYSVALNRACGNYGSYMKLVSRFTQ